MIENTGSWFSSNKEVAKSYSGSEKIMNPHKKFRKWEKGFNYPVYLDIKNPYVYDAKGRNWDSLGDIRIYDNEADEYVNDTDLPNFKDSILIRHGNTLKMNWKMNTMTVMKPYRENISAVFLAQTENTGVDVQSCCFKLPDCLCNGADVSFDFCVRCFFVFIRKHG